MISFIVIIYFIIIIIVILTWILLSAKWLPVSARFPELWKKTPAPDDEEENENDDIYDDTDYDDAVLYTMCDVKELKSMVYVFSVAQNLIAESFQRWHKQ